MVSQLRVVVLIAFVSGIVGLAGERQSVVDAGVVRTEAFDSRGWHIKDGALTGTTIATYRGALHGDFSIRARLSLAKLDGTAASFFLGGGHLGFDGRKQELFLEGEGFPRRNLGLSTTRLAAEKAFLLEATRRGSTLRFVIDGKELVTIPYHDRPVMSFGFRPHRNRMQVYACSVDGELKALPELQYVFRSGEDGYHTYRIPAIVATPTGALLAFAEGRVNGSGDFGNLDIVMKRSEDGGKTWSALRVLQDDGAYQCGNPCPVVDRETGRILLLSCGSRHSEHAVIQGKGSRDVYVSWSDDDGKTWSSRSKISAMTKRPDWRWYATGPCSGIQIQAGRHKGRLVVPANHSVHPENGPWTYACHSLYSDDHGETWQIGESSKAGGNESQIAEVDEGLLLQDVRMQRHGKGLRATRLSRDGGVTWTPLVNDAARPCPVCQGSILVSKPGGTMYASNPAGGGRSGLRVYASTDGGKTWPQSQLIHPGPAAYSNLVMTADGVLGCLFEGGTGRYTEGIAFARVTFE